MKEQSWQQFLHTGEIQAYLNYKECDTEVEDIQEDQEMNMNQEN